MSNRTGLFAVAAGLTLANAAWADLAPPGPRQVAGDRSWMIGAVICAAVAVVVEIALKVAIILFIIRDAPRRGMDPLVWIIAAVFAEVISLIVYLCVRRPLRIRRDDICPQAEVNPEPRE